MAYLNANIPATYAQIRKEYLYDLKKHHGEVEDCIIFGLSSLGGRAILFHGIMEKIKLLSQKIWLDYNHYIIGAGIGLVVGIILF